VATAAQAAAAAAAASQPIDPELALATFDSAWSRINTTYYDPNFRGLDWLAVRAELRPRAAAAGTFGAVRDVITEMLGRLGESHFALFPREAVDAIEPGGASDRSADAGIDLRWVDGELTVARVHEEGSADRRGVRAGWIVDAIGGREVADWKNAIAVADSAAQAGMHFTTISAAQTRLSGAANSSVRVRFRDGADTPLELDLIRQPARGEPVQFGNLPVLHSYLEHARLPTADEGCVGLIRFNVWMVPLMERYNRAVDELSDCDGMIIDIRGNGGGVGGMVMNAAGSFMSDMSLLGVIQSRHGELRLVAMPRRLDTAGRPRTTYTRPVAVLIDELSMSTSEIFAAAMRATGRARLFGTPTPGYALPALMVRLPNRDVLYHAVANLTDPDGERLEGRGVGPDEHIPLTRADLLAGRDRALEQARAWIAADRGASAASRQ
jgi:carboxyl-terminal processing protease